MEDSSSPFEHLVKPPPSTEDSSSSYEHFSKVTDSYEYPPSDEDPNTIQVQTVPWSQTEPRPDHYVRCDPVTEYIFPDSDSEREDPVPEPTPSTSETVPEPTPSTSETVPDSTPREEEEYPDGRWVPVDAEFLKRRAASRPQTPKPIPVADAVGISGCWGSWQSYSRYLSNSLYLIPMHVLLLAMAVSNYVMGFTYWNECPFGSLIPPLFVVMGILGFLCSILQFLRLCDERHPSRGCNFCIHCTLLAANALFIISYIIEVCLFISSSPSHVHGSVDYCQYDFYTYCYWMNWSLFVFMLLLWLVQGPTLKGCEIFSRNQ